MFLVIVHSVGRSSSEGQCRLCSFRVLFLTYRIMYR